MLQPQVLELQEMLVVMAADLLHKPMEQVVLVQLQEVLAVVTLTHAQCKR